ncbi:MAG: GNAT family N-acetyltransferase [Geminicoccaceae bacterium]|nr:GNAT family N-acetyltransferase [Geminicoccaceae bacterium]
MPRAGGAKGRRPDRLVVRPARPDDAAAISAVIRQFSREDGYDSPITAAGLEELAFGISPRVRVILAEQGQTLAGYVLYYPSFDTDHAARGFYLQDVYVRPEARGQGIGRALMAAAARRCLEDGGLYLFWNALETNNAGRAFYRAIGAVEEPVVTLSLQPEALRALADEES